MLIIKKRNWESLLTTEEKQIMILCCFKVESFAVQYHKYGQLDRKMLNGPAVFWNKHQEYYYWEKGIYIAGFSLKEDT